MTNKIFITGTTGLIGFRILLDALAAGHEVRYSARTEKKARAVSANPSTQKLALGDRLYSVIIPNGEVSVAFDVALDCVSHVIHAGSPVSVPTFDPVSEVFHPTVKMTPEILSAALKTPSVRRVVITSSIVASMGLVPATTSPGPTANTCVPPPDPLPPTFGSVFEAYVLAKLVEMRNSDAFAQEHKPHFSIAHVVPGYVFGCNELALDTTMMQAQNSSNNFLIRAMLGAQLPIPIHGVFAHIDDVAEVHLRVAFTDPATEQGCQDYGIGTKPDYGTVFDIVEKAFPKDVAEGVFTRGVVPTMLTEYDSSNTEKLLRRKLKNFHDAVVDLVAQYLEVDNKVRA